MGGSSTVARYTYHCALRWSDMDVYGHVNNARFLTLYEEARVAMMFGAAGRAGVTSLQAGVVISRHEVDYLRPVDYSQPAGDDEPPRVRIEMWLEEIRASYFVVAYELFTAGRLASRARSVCVPFDLAAGRPRRLNQAERAFLQPWLIPTDRAEPASTRPSSVQRPEPVG